MTKKVHHTDRKQRQNNSVQYPKYTVKYNTSTIIFIKSVITFNFLIAHQFSKTKTLSYHENVVQ